MNTLGSHISSTPVEAPRPRIQHPIETRLKVSCGCGALFSCISEGEVHAEDRGHTLTIGGEIRALKTS